MIVFIGWILLAFLVGSFAYYNKGRSFAGYFFLSLLLSPLIGLIIVLIIGSSHTENITNEGKHIKCPYCAEIIKAEARVCRFCGNLIQSTKIQAKDWKCICGALNNLTEEKCPKCSRSRILSLKQVDEKNEWECPHCLHVNPLNKIKCENCRKKKPKANT